MATPLLLGRLYTQRTGVKEFFEFEFDSAFLKRRDYASLKLDPRLGLFEGRQYPAQGQDTFGVLAGPETRLYGSDYLLGVHDLYRVGAVRFRRDDAGVFLDDQHDVAAPPFVQLRALEAASLALEQRQMETFGLATR